LTAVLNGNGSGAGGIIINIQLKKWH